MRKSVSFSSRRLLGLITLFSFICTLTAPVHAASKGDENPRYAAFIMDAGSGLVLYSRNADKPLHPASLTKIMTLLMVFDSLRQGKMRLTDQVPMSAHAASAIPSKLYIPAGGSIQVKDAIYAIVTKSANDVSAAMGEKIGGTESQFAAMMTKRARAIGMSRTTFRNASGLHDPQQVTTARDMATLARYILTNYPEYYHYFAATQFTYRGVTHRNHNHLMSRYQGMDGFKTGYIVPAGFNLVTSAKRGNVRLIGVVFGGRSAVSRDNHMAALLDASFTRMGAGTLVAAAKTPPLPGRKPGAMALASAGNAPGNAAGNAKDVSAASSAASYEVAALRPAAGAAIPAVKPVPPGTARPSVTASSHPVPRLPNIAAQAEPALREAADHAYLIEASYPVSPDAGDRHGQGWSIQVGAFKSRLQTEKAVTQARSRLPSEFSHVTPVIVPLQTREGTLFRARLSGFDEKGALKACAYLPACLPLSPYANASVR